MSAIDDLGFVTLDTIQDVFSYELTRVERDLQINGAPANSRIIVEWIDSIREKLMAQARGNVKDYVINNPHIRQEMRQEREFKDTQSQRKDYLDRIKESRDRAMLGQG